MSITIHYQTTHPWARMLCSVLVPMLNGFVQTQILPQGMSGRSRFGWGWWCLMSKNSLPRQANPWFTNHDDNPPPTIVIKIRLNNSQYHPFKNTNNTQKAAYTLHWSRRVQKSARELISVVQTHNWRSTCKTDIDPHDRIAPIKPSERLRIPTPRAWISSNTIHHQFHQVAINKSTKYNIYPSP